MPETGPREPVVRGGRRRTQEAGNRLEEAGAGAEDMDFSPGIQLDTSQVEMRGADPIAGTMPDTLGTGPQRRGQMERPLTPDEVGTPRENRVPPAGVEFDDSPYEDPAPAYEDEDQEFLFGATDRPDEPLNSGANDARPVPAPNIYRYLGALADAANDPNAPPELFTFIRILEENLSR